MPKIVWPACIPKKLGFRAFSQRCAKSSSRCGHVTLTDLKLGVQKPNFGKCEAFVRQQIQAGSVDLSRSVHVTCVKLFVNCVIDPQVDVATPKTLLFRRWHVCDGPLVSFAYDFGFSYGKTCFSVETRRCFNIDTFYALKLTTFVQLF